MCINLRYVVTLHGCTMFNYFGTDALVLFAKVFFIRPSRRANRSAVLRKFTLRLRPKNGPSSWPQATRTYRLPPRRTWTVSTQRERAIFPFGFKNYTAAKLQLWYTPISRWAVTFVSSPFDNRSCKASAPLFSATAGFGHETSTLISCFPCF